MHDPNEAESKILTNSKFEEEYKQAVENIATERIDIQNQLNINTKINPKQDKQNLDTEGVQNENFVTSKKSAELALFEPLELFARDEYGWPPPDGREIVNGLIIVGELNEVPTSTKGPCEKIACNESDNGNINPDSSLPSENRRTNSKPPFMFAGILGSIFGSVFFSFSMLCIKLLPNGDSFQEKAKALAFRGLFMMILCGSSIIIQNSTFRVKRDELWVNILRAVFGYAGVLGAYCSLNYISLGDSTALVFSSPVWTSILGYFILGEPLQWILLLALPAGLVGIILIAHPSLIVDVDINHPMINLANHSHHLHQPAEWTPPPPIDDLSNLAPPGSFDLEHRWPGIAIALTTSFCVSCVYIVLKFRKSTPIQTTTFWLGFVTCFASLGLMAATGFASLPSSWTELGLLFGNGFCSWVGQSVLQWAFKYEDASVLSIIRTLDVAMSFIMSSLFLDEDIYWTSVLGATIIGLVVISMMLNNWLAKNLCGSDKNVSDGDNSKRKYITNIAVNVQNDKAHLQQRDQMYQTSLSVKKSLEASGRNLDENYKIQVNA